MYQIYVNGLSIGFAETPLYCYKLSSGSPQIIGKYDDHTATGIMYEGTIYNLPGYNDFDGAETATAYEVEDVGTLLTHQAARIAELEIASSDADELNIDHELRITMIELGIDEF